MREVNGLVDLCQLKKQITCIERQTSYKKKRKKREHLNNVTASSKRNDEIIKSKFAHTNTL